MKTPSSPLGALLAFACLLGGAARLHAQGTAFTYQGRLNDGANPANGSYDLTFSIWNAASGPGQVGGPLTNAPTAVSNGLFTVALDFGGGVFAGLDRWLEIAVRTNGGGAFTNLSPRQKLTPTPYAIFANSASNLLGTLPAGQLSGAVLNGQLANSSVTVTAGTGLSGGGAVALGGSTTLNNAGVLSVTGNGDITASTLNGAVTLGSTATSANTPNAIVKRDANGDFAAGTITLNTNLNLPASTASAGVVYSAGQTLLHEYGTGNFFAGLSAGNLTLSGQNNTGVGTYALGSDTSGSGNTASGYGALYYNTSGGHNTASGTYALYSNTNGVENTANGYGALFNNTSGNYNTANGYEALFNNTTGFGNEAYGDQALYSNTDGYGNTAIGGGALYANTSGFLNTAIGGDALGSLTNGFENTAVGFAALRYLTNGYRNIALGEFAGITTRNGSVNIYIGDNPSGVVDILHLKEEDYSIHIGEQGTHIATYIAGIFGTPAFGSAVYVDSNGQLSALVSSARFKDSIRDMADASDVLLSLRPVAFRYKPDIDPKGIPQFGLVAEEVDKVDPDLVVRDAKNQIYSVRYEAVNAMLLNEFLKQHRQVKEQQAEIESLKEKAAAVEDLKARLEKLERRLNGKTGRAH